MRRIPVAILILLVGCQGGLLGKRESVSHMQYRTLEKGMRAAAVIRAFGKPSDVLEKEGRIRGLSYRCQDARGVVGIDRLEVARQPWRVLHAVVLEAEERRANLGGPHFVLRGPLLLGALGGALHLLGRPAARLLAGASHGERDAERERPQPGLHRSFTSPKTLIRL